ncbi:flagellar filament capping protein FliD [Aquifex pyrophilus]
MAGEIYLPGFSGAYDWGAMLDQLMAVKSIPIQKLNREKQIINQKIQLISEFSKKVNDLKNLIENFNLDDALLSKSASVSHPDVLSVSVRKEAPEITFEVNVLNTASVEILVYDSGFNSLEEQIGSSGSFTLRYYKTDTEYEGFTIEYNSTDTLQDIVNKINEAQSLVKASIYYDGNKYKLMLSETSPENSTVETSDDLSTKVIHLLGTLPPQFGNSSLIQKAQNAKIQVGSGSVIESAGSTFENVITGIDITVKETGSSRVEVRQDFGKVKEFLNNFVKSYNKLVNNVKSLTLGENAPFRGENTIMGVKYELSDALDPLIELGIIEYKEDGSIALSGNLEQVIEENPDVFKLKMEEFINTAGGVLRVSSDSFKEFTEFLQDKVERIDERIKLLSERLAREEELLRRQFSQLESFMSYANDVRERLKQFIVTLSEMSGGNKK